MFLLTRDRRDSAIDHIFFLTKGVELNFQGRDVRVEGRDDRASQRGQIVVHLLDDRVVGGVLRHQVLITSEKGIVEFDLCRDSLAVDGDNSWYHLGLLARVEQIVLQELGHADLVF